MCDKSRNTWLCVHWQWNTLEWCQLNALQASPVVHLVTPLSCVSLSMNTQPSVPTIAICYNLQLVHNKLLGAPSFVRLVCCRKYSRSILDMSLKWVIWDHSCISEGPMRSAQDPHHYNPRFNEVERGNTGFTSSVRPSVHPSVYRIVSTL